jgi:hypothetical protein
MLTRTYQRDLIRSGASVDHSKYPYKENVYRELISVDGDWLPLSYNRPNVIITRPTHLSMRTDPAKIPYAPYAYIILDTYFNLPVLDSLDISYLMEVLDFWRIHSDSDHPRIPLRYGRTLRPR